MPTQKNVQVKDLSLDLKNYRVSDEKSEVAKIRSLISSSPARFWALAKSLLDDGYHPTENIIVVKRGKDLIVREGNRRVSALKILLGLSKLKNDEIQADILVEIGKLTNEKKSGIESVPCVIYPASSSEIVDRIVALTHGKDEAAAREKWSPVAKARYNRDRGQQEYGLDVLEKFLISATNITADQRKRWGGDFSLTMLDELVQKSAKLLNFTAPSDLSAKYPKIEKRKQFDDVIQGIGTGTVKFETIRDPGWLAAQLGIPIEKKKEESKGGSGSNGPGGTKGEKSPEKESSPANPTAPSGGRRLPVAAPVNSQISVRRLFRNLKPRGKNRGKLVSLIIEAVKIPIEDCPHSFCFLLRSIFEISAKAYADDHQIPTATVKNNKSYDKSLSDLLDEIISKLTNNGTDQAMKRKIHGAKTELKRSDGILSMTSMNQLVHNPRYSIAPNDIYHLVGNVFPLLEVINE